MKKGTMIFAAVKAVAKADPVWKPGCHQPNLAAQTAPGEMRHLGFPVKVN
jgi:hypothetical protein